MFEVACSCVEVTRTGGGEEDMDIQLRLCSSGKCRNSEDGGNTSSETFLSMYRLHICHPEDGNSIHITQKGSFPPTRLHSIITQMTTF